MATVNELITAFGFELKDDTLRKMNYVETGIEKISYATEKLGKFFTGGRGIVEYFKQFVGASNELINLSKATGMSTSSLQQWQYAADKVGVSADNVVSDLANLTNRFGMTKKQIFSLADDMKKGGRFYAQQVGGDLGLSQDTITLLREGAAALKQYGFEAVKMGAITNQETLKKTAELHRKAAIAMRSLGKATDEVVAKAVPGISKLMTSFNNWLGENPDTKINIITTSLVAMTSLSIISGLASLATNLTLVAKGMAAIAAVAATKVGALIFGVGAGSGVGGALAGLGLAGLLVGKIAAIGTTLYHTGDLLGNKIAQMITGEAWYDDPRSQKSLLEEHMDYLVNKGFELGNKSPINNNSTTNNNGGNTFNITINGNNGETFNYDWLETAVTDAIQNNG